MNTSMKVILQFPFRCEHWPLIIGKITGYALHSRFMRPQVKKTEVRSPSLHRIIIRMEAHTTQYWKREAAKGLAPNSKKPEEAGKSDMMLFVNVT
jgi:hypothetical protein